MSASIVCRGAGVPAPLIPPTMPAPPWPNRPPKVKRAVQLAMVVIEALPPYALAMLADRIIDRLDAVEDADAEPLLGWVVEPCQVTPGGYDAADREGDDDADIEDDDPAEDDDPQGDGHCGADDMEGAATSPHMFGGSPVTGSDRCLPIRFPCAAQVSP